MSEPPRVLHALAVPDPRGHLLSVRSTFEAESLPDPLELVLPVWTPGSYLVREYARHVESLAASTPTGACRVEKVRKNAWHVWHGGAAEVTVAYTLYANDLTVRTNHVDAYHLLVTGAATFLFAAHAPDAGARVSVAVPGFEVITPLEQRDGEFFAPDYDTLVDAPIHACATPARTLEIAGRPFVIVTHGRAPKAPRAELERDVRAIVEAEAALLGGVPWSRYVLVLLDSAPSRGGLEHRNAAVLTLTAAAYDDRAAVLDTLSLIAHEVLHAWNVKRIRPAALTPYDYEREQYTRALWWFEGGTSYFDFRFLRLAAVCTDDEWLDHLGHQIGRLEDTPGRRRQSLAEASFDAWIKAYRPDESTASTAVSYYLKGELVCLLLDVTIRVRTAGGRSLDDFLSALHVRFGRPARPVSDAELEETLEEVAGVPLRDVLDPWLHGTEELPIDDVLGSIGLEVVRQRKRSRGSLGVRTRQDHGRTVVTSVLRGRAGHAAGLDPGDELVAIDGVRVEGRIEAVLADHAPGTTVEVLVSRGGVLTTFTAELEPTPFDLVRVVRRGDVSAEIRALREAFLRAADRGTGAP
ncbi:MAG: M61 family metallopeptidase [Myxococcales bacterium]|nr:M61 family metallopeptidase [Myxococcales bacterium]